MTQPTIDPQLEKLIDDFSRVVGQRDALLAVCKTIAEDSRFVRLHTQHQLDLMVAIALCSGEAVTL